MNTRVSLLNSPLLLGFDHLERMVDRAAKGANDGYPPYNIEQIAEDHLRITLAVAGFRRDDLDISIEDNQLIIKGRQADDKDRVFLHRGIAARQFQKAFVLAEGIEVTGADLADGMLMIDFHRPKPVKTVKKVEIGKGGSGHQTLDV